MSEVGHAQHVLYGEAQRSAVNDRTLVLARFLSRYPTPSLVTRPQAPVNILGISRSRATRARDEDVREEDGCEEDEVYNGCSQVLGFSGVDGQWLSMVIDSS